MKKFNKIKFGSVKRGFTLVEVLIATGIIVLMIGMAAGVEMNYLNSANLAKHNLQANNLAEEGLALVKTIRDKKLIVIPPEDSLTALPSNNGEIIYCLDNITDPTVLAPCESPNADGEKIILNDYEFIRKIFVKDENISGGGTPPPAVPNPPSPVILAANSQSQLTASWSDLPDETGFKVFFSTTVNPDCSLAIYPVAPNFTLGANVLSQPLAGLLPDSQYCSKVIATNASGDSAPAYAVSPRYTLAAPIMMAPTINPVLSTSIAIIMNASMNPSTVEFAISCDNDNTFLNYSTNACGAIADDANHWRPMSFFPMNTFTDTGLGVNTNHTYKIMARNRDKVNTALSSGASKYTRANTPTAPTVTNTINDLIIIPGKVLTFDGAGDYVRVNTYPQATTTLTVSAWVKITSRTSWATLIKNWGFSRGQFQLGLFSTNYDASFFINQGNNTEVYTREGSATPLPIGSWQHLVGVADGSFIRLYRNGVQVGTPTAYNGAIYNPLIKCLNFGAKGNDACTAPDGGAPGYLNGSLDDVRIYNRALSVAEVSQLYNNAAVSDTNLVGWWKLDDGSGTTATDSASSNSGTLYNGSTNNPPADGSLNGPIWKDRESISDRTSLNIKVNLNSNPTSTQFSIQESTTGKFIQTDGTLNVTQTWRTYTDWGGAGGTINTGLTPNTTYTYMVMARNGNNVTTSYSPPSSNTTKP